MIVDNLSVIRGVDDHSLPKRSDFGDLFIHLAFTLEALVGIFKLFIVGVGIDMDVLKAYGWTYARMVD
jgi:hypothetical protein